MEAKNKSNKEVTIEDVIVNPNKMQPILGNYIILFIKKSFRFRKIFS